MKQLQHFCHQHPLIICDELHTCAEAPMMIEYPMHHYHPHLEILQSLMGDRKCNVCDLDLGMSYSYVCPDKLCPFQICLNCCFQQGRNIKHPGHNYEDHALTLVQRPALFRCDACGEKHKDSSYTCNACPFWMHHKCAFVPTSIECKIYDDHPLALVCSLPERYRRFKQMCNICNREVKRIYWLYYCVKCRFFAHIKCATSTAGRVPLSYSESDEESRYIRKLFHFPATSTNESKMDQMIQQFGKADIDADRRRPEQIGRIDLMIQQFGKMSMNLMMLQNFHKRMGTMPVTIVDLINFEHWAHKDHPLVRSDQLQRNNNINTTEIQMLCDGCVRPILTDPFYGCAQCKFFLHVCCVELPLMATHLLHPEHELVIHNHVKPNIYVKCDFCDNICNGMFFYCKPCNFYLDIKCASLPDTIKYVAHRHPLGLLFDELANCKACGELINHDRCYGCTECKFYLHGSCILLPGTINHRWDPHPIPLVHPPIKDHPDEFYCEICEEEISGTFHSFYFCRPCDQSFHVRCLRPYYAYSNIKFGATNVTVDKHPHSLTLAAMQQHKLPHSKCKCGNCGDRIPDGSPMLECQPCHFRLCTKCDSTSEASLPEYFEYDSTSGQASRVEYDSNSDQASMVEYFEYDSNSDQAPMVEYDMLTCCR